MATRSVNLGNVYISEYESADIDDPEAEILPKSAIDTNVDAKIAAHVALSDPHTQYLTASEAQTVLTNSAGLAAALSDETGTGLAVFNTSPAFATQITTPKIVTASVALEITPSGNNDIILQGSGTGNVGVGTTTPPARFVSSNGGANGIELDTAGTNYLTSYNRSTSAYTAITYRAASHLFNIDGSVDTLKIISGKVGVGITPTVEFELSGSVGQKASGTTWSNPSDARLKDILGPADLQRCYDDVKALELKRYRVKDDCFTTKQITDRTVTGLVAGDVQRIIPKAVNVVPFSKVPVLDGEEEYQEQVKDKDGVVEMVTKSRPKYRTDVIEDCLNLDMSQVYMQLMGAVQLLIQKVEILEAR